MAEKAPNIDGVMEKGEWSDATAFSGFWYLHGMDLKWLAPAQIQSRVYGMYDKDYLYLAVVYPVYPAGSWLKANGRFPDVLRHPQYGALWDDHVELELRPYHDAAKGFKLGLMRWDVNSLNTVCDWTWSLTRGTYDMAWQSKALIRSKVDDKQWVIEYAIPFRSLVWGDYAGRDEAGAPLVTIPPPDGTIYRFWVCYGLIGLPQPLYQVFDQNVWNTTKGQLLFDSKACSFQINDIGPFMEDMIDVKLTVKNHNSRSETVRIGFFVENTEGLVYSSYDAPDLKDGMLELRPGELREIQLKKAMPGISKDGNVLWFDVRSAGTPAKILFRARLMKFHAMEGGADIANKSVVDPVTREKHTATVTNHYVDTYLTSLATARAGRSDFSARFQFSPYDKRIYTVLDRGGPAASEDARRAVEAKMIVMRDDVEETVMKEVTIPFTNDFGFFLFEVPDLANGEKYKSTILLFDHNQRIVAEKNLDPFVCKTGPWLNTTLGLDDVVWEGFEPIKVEAAGFETIKHKIAVSPLGLPAQITIKPDPRDLPLEKRALGAGLTAAELQELGRGPQLRRPVELAVMLNGVRVMAKVVKPAARIRTGQSEVEYAATLKVGPLDVTLNTRYDCDGALHCKMDYGSVQTQKIERFELLMPVGGRVDIAFSETGKGSMTAADTWDCTLPDRAGVVWDSALARRELAYGRFVPWFWFGSADRGWTWFCDSSEGWVMDDESGTIQMERDKAGNATMRVVFVNHPVEITGTRSIAFTLLTSPAKNKPRNFRSAAWHYTLGPAWCAGYWNEPYDLPEAVLKSQWRQAASAPRELPDSEMTKWRKDEPPFMRYGKWRNVQAGFSAEAPNTDRLWEDKATYLFERQIRVGRRVGWHMDEYWPIQFGRSDNLAMGNGYLRDPSTVSSNTPIPWEEGYTTRNMRDHYKRLARISKLNNVPQRHMSWANNEATMLESCWWASVLVEECGAMHRSFDVDMVTQFPNSIYRYLAHNWSGLATAILADQTEAEYGDDKRLDRQQMGRALLNDIGLTPAGPHGIIYHREDMVKLLTALTGFGFFEDQDIEKLPYWRNREVVRLGEKPSVESEVYVTVYRRPLKDGKGYQALFVVMNESFKPVELPLTLVDVNRILGGANTLTAGEVREFTPINEELKGWWAGVNGRLASEPVLMDVETGDVVVQVAGGKDVYGPVYVPYHDFRIFMARHETGKTGLNQGVIAAACLSGVVYTVESDKGLMACPLQSAQ